MRIAVAFIIAIWTVFLVDMVLPGDFNNWGLVPRSLSGLVGIVTMPFLHGNLGHIISNTVPILILMSLLGVTSAKSSEIVAELIVAAGVLLWLFGTKNIHIGASGLVYALVTYLVMSGWWSKNPQKTAIGLFVAVFYGGLVWGVLPTQPGVSWTGHLFGAIAGIITASGQVKTGGIEKGTQ
tara:strand:- start:275 stop:817 length:543 start_codon:yes stop_codon:yes gene_type:complete